MLTEIEGQRYYWTALHDDGEIISVIPLLLGRARIIRHVGYSAAEYRVLEGW